MPDECSERGEYSCEGERNVRRMHKYAKMGINNA